MSHGPALDDDGSRNGDDAGHDVSHGVYEDVYDDLRAVPPGQRRVDALRPRHYGRVPRIDVATWTLTVSGETVDGSQLALTWEDLADLPRMDLVADHHCASRDTVLDVAWSGIPCRAVIDLLPPAADAPNVHAYGAYGYQSNVTVDDLLSPRALFATHLDGRPLPPQHGWPMRLVLPHLYGWKGPKWLMAIEYRRYPQRGFWEQRGYHLTGDAWREERYSHHE